MSNHTIDTTTSDLPPKNITKKGERLELRKKYNENAWEMCYYFLKTEGGNDSLQA